MDTKTAEAILELYTEKRAIELWIKERFVRKEGSRLRRGPIQRQMASDLGLNINPDFYKKVQKAFTSMGVRHIKIDSIGHYGELAYKETV